jgi:predicted nuclease of predicted toxin-antitoxin system
MIFWLDAQLPPSLANWLVESFSVEAIALRDLMLRDSPDTEIFESARQDGIVIVTKDRDFLELVQRLGTPPQILWLTCGNLTNQHLRQLLDSTFLQASQLLEDGEPIVEIGD